MAASNDFSATPAAGRRLSAHQRHGFVAGTAADTVIWYTGEDGPDPARGTRRRKSTRRSRVLWRACQRAGHSLGRAERGALAAMTFSQSDPNAVARSTALNQRVVPRSTCRPARRRIDGIEAELAGAQTTMKAATDRHTQTKSTLADMLAQIEGVVERGGASKIMALQTSLQASLQTTSLLFKTSLVNYI